LRSSSAARPEMGWSAEIEKASPTSAISRSTNCEVITLLQRRCSRRHQAEFGQRQATPVLTLSAVPLNGQTATAQTRSVINSRRFIDFPCAGNQGELNLSHQSMRAMLCVRAKTVVGCPLWVKSRHRALFDHLVGPGEQLSSPMRSNEFRVSIARADS
jgi:hypothetical protein